MDNWVGFTEKAFTHRKFQQQPLLEFTKGIQKILHAIFDIDRSTTFPAGLDVRKAVGILVYDNIESLRMQASPYKPMQLLKVQSNILQGLWSRQKHVAAIVRGIFEEVPEAQEPLNGDMIGIIGRNEKEHGKGYFMKHYANNKPDKTEKKENEEIIKNIAKLYQNQQKNSEEKRKKRHAKLMDVLLVALSAPDEPSRMSLHRQVPRRLSNWWMVGS